MAGYRPEQWTDFFIASAGAAAALAGLVIVAISVNVRQILEFKSLPAHTAATVATLVLILVSATAGLIPGQSVKVLGAEILAFGLTCWGLALRSAYMGTRASTEHHRSARSLVVNVAFNQIAVLPFIIGGVSLIAESGGGLYWVAAGTLIAFVVSVLNAWVLLIEILR